MAARRRSPVASRAPFPVAPDCDRRAADAPIASVNFPRPQVHAPPQARASVRGGGAEPRTQGPTR